MIGTQIAHYDILEELGRGGMGVVYKAEDKKLNRLVALKVLAAHLAHDTLARNRFLREARAVATLDHDNICTVYDASDAESGETYMAMAYYEGETLDQRIADNPLTHEQAGEIFSQVLKGLEAAHEKGIVHRDIKPSNIFITSSGTVKILDFGLAKVQDASVLTREGTVQGTLAYMSPEQVRGAPVDHRTDIWSFGVVLYESLTGVRPFQATYEQALYYEIVNTDPVTMVHMAHDSTVGYSDLITQCLKKNPTERPKDVAALRRLMDSGIKADVVKAGQIGWPHVVSFFCGIVGVLLGISFRGTSAQLEVPEVAMLVAGGVLSSIRPIRVWRWALIALLGFATAYIMYMVLDTVEEHNLFPIELLFICIPMAIAAFVGAYSVRLIALIVASLRQKGWVEYALWILLPVSTLTVAVGTDLTLRNSLVAGGIWLVFLSVAAGITAFHHARKPWRWGLAAVLLMGFQVPIELVLRGSEASSLISFLVYPVMTLPITAIISIPAFGGAYLGAYISKKRSANSLLSLIIPKTWIDN